MVQLKNDFTKWVELSEVEKLFDGVMELMVRKQFANAYSKDLSVYLNERSAKALDELVIWAEHYLMADNKKLSSAQRHDGEMRRYEGIWKRKEFRIFSYVVGAAAAKDTSC